MLQISRARSGLMVLLLVAAIAATFYSILGHGFVDWDDYDLIVENPGLNPVTLPGVLSFWTHSYKELYTPVSYTILAALAWVQPPGAPQAGGLFHAASLAIHTVNALLALTILKRLTGSISAAGFGALLFALHPLQVEAVAWAAGINNLIATTLGLCAIWQYLLYRTGQRRRWHYAMATAAFGLALLAKPTTVVVPVVLAILDGLLLRRPWRQMVIPLLPWVAMTLPLWIVTRLVQPAGNVDVPAMWARPLVASDAFVFYMGKLLLPMRLAVDYGRTPGWLLNQGFAYAIWIIPAGLLAIAWRLRHRRPWALAGLGVFVAGWAAVSGLTPFAFQRISTVADRYVYLAMLGPAILLSAGLTNARSKGGATTAAVILCLLAWQSHRQCDRWQNTLTLFEDNLRVFPDSPAAHHTLAFAYARQHNAPAADEHYRAAAALRPDDPEIRYNWGNLLLRQGQFDQAVAQYQAALPHMNKDVRLLLNLGAAYANAGDFPHAVEVYQQAVKLAPQMPQAQRGLAAALRAARK